jgi:ABC-type transport system involved in multi-copper enzyme maturation permease subunit
MSVSAIRVRTIYRKELREYRRNGSIIAGMAIIALVFVFIPLIEFIAVPASDVSALRQGDALAYMLGIPAIVPAFVAAYSVVGERQQGTLEPVLTTPIRREELLLGKALAALVPSLAVAYVVYAFVLACIELFAQPAVASALIQGPEVLAQLLFTPLIAGWSIWVAMAISTRSSDSRVAQQLSVLGGFPTILVANLISFNAIHATLGLALGLAALLLVLDVLGWRAVSAAFDRERLVTGTRS